MLKTRVIPSLLLKNGGLVKTMKFKDPTYIGDPINAVRIFNEKEVDELVFLDITVSAEGGIPALKIIQEVAEECFMPLAYGGGLTSQEQIRSVFNLGVEKAVICTAAIKNPEFVQRAADTFGSQSITICLDYRRNLFGQCEVWTHSGMRNTKLEVVKMADRMQAMGAGELILNSIDRDGTMQGYDLDLLQKVCQAVEIPVVASGGAGRLEHFREAVNVGASAVAAGSMFVFHGRHRAVLISYPTSKELSSILP